MKLALLLLSAAAANPVSGWVVDANLHGCNFGGAGYCAGTVTLQTGREGGEAQYRSFAVPWTVPIEGADGKKPVTLRYDGWAEIGYVERDGVQTATWVRMTSRSGGPQPLKNRRGGFDVSSMSAEELNKYLTGDFISHYAQAVKALLERGDSSQVRKELKCAMTSDRYLAAWSIVASGQGGFDDDMKSLLSDADPTVRGQAVHYFKKQKVPAVAERVSALLKDLSPQVRQVAAEYMGELKLARYKPQLEALKSDKEIFVRTAAEKALAALPK